VVPPEHVERRLAAILAADVAGYSRLMGADEEGTLARLKAHRRELIDPMIAEHRGRVVKTTGDGMLVEFPSAIDAVRCAIDLQHGMAGRNVGVAEDERIAFRIGINLGDIIIDGDDILGDGVNIAARLETISEPGGISVSEEVWRLVERKVPARFVDCGEQRLKNIARPVRVYRVAAEGAEPPAGENGRTSVAAPRLSIVVLPFASLSGDAAEDYFADGITEDVTTDLSRIPDSFVIARNTAFTYKGKATDARRIGRELGVRYVLEGSVRRGGNRVRTNIQLIDAESGAHLWAERFDCDRADLMEVQDEITGRVANALDAQLIDAESRRSLREHPTNPDAVDLSMRGWAMLHQSVSRESLTAARSLFNEALARDERATDAAIGLAYTYARTANSGLTDTPEADLAEAERHVGRALALGPDRAKAHWVRGLILRTQRQVEQAVAAFETAIALDRNFAGAYGALGDVVTFLGKPEETIVLNHRAMRLSPRDPELGNWQFDIGFAYLLLEKYDDAVNWALRARATNPKLPFVSSVLAAAYGMTGRLEEARLEIAKFEGTALGTLGIRRLKNLAPFEHPGIRDRAERILFQGLRDAGMPE
jgi:adenylate cyclase